MAKPMVGLAGVERAGGQAVGRLGTVVDGVPLVPAAAGAVTATAGTAQPAEVEAEPAPRTRTRAPRAASSATGSGPIPLATGVYAGGSIGLEIGHRYTIARHDRELVILGPVETTPTETAHRRELARIDPVGVDDRLVITGTEGERGRYLVRFQAVAGMATEQVEQQLAAPVEPTLRKGTAAARRARTDG
jgi:hypothetical protein